MFWNGYWISFIMTVVGFAAFSITAEYGEELKKI
jgi:hypothetical protein